MSSPQVSLSPSQLTENKLKWGKKTKIMYLLIVQALSSYRLRPEWQIASTINQNFDGLPPANCYK